MKTIKSNFFNIMILLALGVVVYQNHYQITNGQQGAQRQQQRPPQIPVGAKLENISGTDLEGHPATLAWNDPHDSRPVLAYIFQPGCHWCARNEANFEALYKATKDKYRFVGLSPRLEGSAQEPESKLGIPIYVDYAKDKNASILRQGTPTTVMVENGKVTQVWTGAWNEATASAIEKALSVKLPGLTSEPSKPSTARSPYKFPVQTAGFFPAAAWPAAGGS